MKPEPLKNKRKKPLVFKDKYFPHQTFFLDEDIKSAVEWLKKQYKNPLMDKLVDKAFEDVMKK